MIADSIKVQGFSCFKDNWIGFDEFKPITVIIGRNNTGKSHLIDLVKLLTKERENEKPKNTDKLQDFTFSCKSTFDEEFLRKRFRENVDTHALGSGDDWHRHGNILVGKDIEWRFLSDTREVIIEKGEWLSESIVNHLGDSVLSVGTVLGKKFFRRIAADRDVTHEAPADNLQLSWDGTGATDIIRKHLNSRKDDFPETLVKNEVLDGLKTVFGPDGDFTDIRIREDDENDEEDKKWEIFLYETGKEPAPLSKSGSGLKTVLLVLLNLLVIPRMEGKEEGDYVFAFEELENNLHPALLRRLFDFLTEYVRKHKCHLFLTTHSSVALDFFSTLEDAQIIQVTHDGTSASAKTIKAHFDKVGVLNDLGAKPSDLLQANGIIWLEGPSDRIYLNKFIEIYSGGDLREGRDYQCAFYGGSVLAITTFDTPEEANDEYANLLRLNHNVAVVCDSDTTYEEDELKARVMRIQEEVDKIPENAFLWITKPKEIENYLPGEVWQKAEGLTETIPDPDENDRFPSTANEDDFYKKHCCKTTFNKTKFAAKAEAHLTKELLADRFDMNEQMEKLVETIRTWNN